MARETGRRGQRMRGPMVGLLAGLCPSGRLSGETAWAKTKPVLILPYQSTESDTWFGEAIAETLFVAAQGTPALLPDRSGPGHAGSPGSRGRTAPIGHLWLSRVPSGPRSSSWATTSGRPTTGSRSLPGCST